MPKVFYLSEVVKFAIEKEIESFELYKTLASKTIISSVKNLFMELMDQELEHKDFFSKILAGIETEHTTNVSEDEEYQSYMQELIAESRKIAPAENLNYNDLNSVLAYAIGREKDSILFYIGLKNFVTDSAHEHIEEIIREEAKHITKILEIKRALSRDMH